MKDLFALMVTAIVKPALPNEIDPKLNTLYWEYVHYSKCLNAIENDYVLERQERSHLGSGTEYDPLFKVFHNGQVHQLDIRHSPFTKYNCLQSQWK